MHESSEEMAPVELGHLQARKIFPLDFLRHVPQFVRMHSLSYVFTETHLDLYVFFTNSLSF